jgi:hypothetical protein
MTAGMKYIVISLMSFILIAGLATTPALAQWGMISIDTLTSENNRKNSDRQAFDLDFYGFGHVAWKEPIHGGLANIIYCSNSPDGIWRTPVVIGDAQSISYPPALAVSLANNQPYIAFSNDLEVFVVNICQDTVITSQVTANDQLDISCSIAIDNDGNIHLAWITEDPITSEYKIAYALGNMNAWDIKILNDSYLGEYGTGADPFIAVSSEGAAHIVYRGGDYMMYRIHHARNDTLAGENWIYETAASGNLEDYTACLAINDNDDLHLALSGNDGWGMPGRVFYNYKPADGNWWGPQLVTSDYSGTEPSLDLDIYGVPHVVWMETAGNFYTGRIYYSCEGSDNDWQVDEVIGEDHYVPSFKVDHLGHGRIVCYTAGGTGDWSIYHIAGDIATSIEDDNRLIIPDRSYILRNYPNPFNSKTAINYVLPVSGFVTMGIYNCLGEEVEELFGGFQNAGEHTLVWTPAKLSSGIYFYRLKCGQDIIARRCLLLK